MGNAKLAFPERRVLAIFRRGARRGESQSVQMVNRTRATATQDFRQRGVLVTSRARDEVFKREKRRDDASGTRAGVDSRMERRWDRKPVKNM